MMEYVLANKNTDNDKKAIQDALDTAFATGLGTVIVPKGDWKLDSAVCIPEYTRLILDGANLSLTEDSEGENLIMNGNAKTSFGFTNGAMQTGITISGKNGATLKSKLPIFLRNVKNFTVENLKITSTESFALFIMMGANGKIRNIDFSDCVRGIGVGATTRDCFFNDISGTVKDYAFDFDNALYKKLSYTAKGYDIINHIIRDVKLKTENVFAHFDGEGKINPVLSDKVGRIIFTNAEIEKPLNIPAFLIESAYDVVLQSIKTDGILVNKNLTPEQIYIYDTEKKGNK